jgi:hypothetical protein
MPSTRDRLAPSATRTPISARRLATLYETTPYRPTSASTSATTPNNAARRAIRRSCNSAFDTCEASGA